MPPTNLYDAVPGTSAAAAYTNTTSGEVTVTSIVATNETTNAATVTIEHVPAGQSPGSGYIVVDAESVAANASVDLPSSGASEPIIALAPGDALYVLQGTASAVHLEITGESPAFS